MSVHTIMNSPVTRIQVFAVFALCALMAIGTLGYITLQRFGERLPPPAAGGHGIETAWPSSAGENRLWTLGTGDFRPWLDEHVAAVKEAQQVLPIKEK